MERPKPFYKAIIARPEDIKPSSDMMQVVGVFNPGVAEIKKGGVRKTLLMMRVAETPKEKPKGEVLLPYFQVENRPDSPFKIEFDRISKRCLRSVGKKEVTFRKGQLTRLRHISYFKNAISNDGKKIDLIEDGSSFYPCFEHERFGVEDPRITKINGGRYVMSYVTAHRKYGVSTSLATTKDFKRFERLSYLGEPRPIFRDKDVSLLGKKLPIVFEQRGMEGKVLKYAALTRPSSYPGISNPHICVSFSSDLMHWGPQIEFSENENERQTGAGAPAVETDGIWLDVHHETRKRGRLTIYLAVLSGFDPIEPWKFKYRPKILFGPNEFDIGPGFVRDSVYPLGMLVRDGIVDIYSGENDFCISARSFYKDDLIDYVKDD